MSDSIACQALLSMGFPKPQYWSTLAFPTLVDLPGQGIELAFLASPHSLPLVPPGMPEKQEAPMVSFLWKFYMLKTQEERMLVRQEFCLTLRRANLFFLFISSTELIRATYSKEGNLLYSVYHLNVNLIKKKTVTEITRISGHPKIQSMD